MAITFSSNRIGFTPLAAPLSSGLTTMTYAAWVYPTTLTGGGFGNMVIENLDTGATFALFLFVTAAWGTATNTMIFFYPYATSGGAWSPPNGSISINTKYHLAASYDNSSISNTPTLWINGVSQSVNVVQSPSGTLQTPANGTISVGQQVNGTYPFIGKIEDVRIYNRILNGSDISSIYNGGSPTSFETNDNGLVFHAPMLIGTGITPPWNGTILAAGNKIIDRINCVQGTPAGSPVGTADFVYGTSY